MRLADLAVPPELAEQLAADGEFAAAHAALSANHQRKIVEHFLEAKTPAGQAARLEKIVASVKWRR